MNSFRFRITLALAATLSIYATSNPIAAAIELPIINPSFELLSRPLAVGEQTNGAGGAGVSVGTRFPFVPIEPNWDNPVEVPGWRTRLTEPGSSDYLYAGVLNPPLVGGQPFIEGQDGQNVLAVQIAQAGQVINRQLEPNTRYRLDFLGGIGRFDSDYSLSPSLIAAEDLNTLPLENFPGVTRLAIARGLKPDPGTFGTMLPYSLEYTTPKVLPAELQGKYIGVHVYGSDGLPRVIYDNFRLEAQSLELTCDFDQSGGCDIVDLDDILAEGPLALGVPTNVANAQFDLTGDDVIDLQDVNAWLADAAVSNGLASPYKMGDANLDGQVDGEDFLRWSNAKFTSTLRWSDANFDGDGVVSGQDFLLWNANKSTASVVAVPEPELGIVSIGLMLCLAIQGQGLRARIVEPAPGCEALIT